MSEDVLGPLHVTLLQARIERLKAENSRRDELLAQVGRRLQEMASNGNLDRYVIQDCADALLGRQGAPGSEFDRVATEKERDALKARIEVLTAALTELLDAVVDWDGSASLASTTVRLIAQQFTSTLGRSGIQRKTDD